MNKPLVSVIVPVYKVEDYLDKCVKSIVAQTYENLEIILVDDGSPDNCPSMCDSWAQKDSRIKVIHKENGGVSSARNSALDAAAGDYICFVDSDDFIEPNAVGYMLENIGDAMLYCARFRMTVWTAARKIATYRKKSFTRTMRHAHSSPTVSARRFGESCIRRTCFPAYVLTARRSTARTFI